MGFGKACFVNVIGFVYLRNIFRRNTLEFEKPVKCVISLNDNGFVYLRNIFRRNTNLCMFHIFR